MLGVLRRGAGCPGERLWLEMGAAWAEVPSQERGRGSTYGLVVGREVASRPYPCLAPTVQHPGASALLGALGASFCLWMWPGWVPAVCAGGLWPWAG